MQMEQRFQVGKMMGEMMQNCIQACTTCHGVCVESINHCLRKGGRHTEFTHLRILTDCAEICQTSADFMLRGSEFHGMTCGVCAEVCTHCAESCAMFGDDEMMKRCEEACRMCAKSCAEMAEQYNRSHF
jgi:hypothetical protein